MKVDLSLIGSCGSGCNQWLATGLGSLSKKMRRASKKEDCCIDWVDI